MSNFEFANNIKINLNFELNETENSKKELTVELSYDELKPYFEKALEKFRKDANIPGFRKGKAPMTMIKKLYSEGIEYSSLEDIVNEIFVKYLAENKIDILGSGAISDIDYKPKENLKFKVQFETPPEVKIENYKNLDLKKTKYVIDDSLVDDELEYHKFRNATNEIDGVASDDNYIITVDLQNLDEAGNILIGQSSKDMKIFLGNPGIHPEFKEAFKGIKEGEVKVIDSLNSEGGPKKVRITCTKVEKIIYPEMNEEFFKKITRKEVKTEEEFRAAIKEELQKIYAGISKRKLHEEVINELIKLAEINVPEKYTDTILNGMITDYKNQLPKRQLPKDFNAEEFKKEKRVDAILIAKWYLIREKLIELEKIEVNDADYEKAAEESPSRHNIPLDKLIQAYKENDDVKLKILNDKVIDFIISNSNVSEMEEVMKKENDPLIKEV